MKGLQIFCSDRCVKTLRHLLLLLNSRFSRRKNRNRGFLGCVRRVVRWLEKCCLFLQGWSSWSKKSLHCLIAYSQGFLMRDSRFSWLRNRSRDFLGRCAVLFGVYISLIMNFSPEDGSSTASETLVFNHQTTRRNSPEKRPFCFFTVICPKMFWCHKENCESI